MPTQKFGRSKLFTLENKIGYKIAQLPNTHDFNGHDSELREIEVKWIQGESTFRDREGNDLFKKKWKEPQTFPSPSLEMQERLPKRC